MNEKRLFLIDATAFCYRAFYAISGLSTSFGQPTNAVFGFTSMLNKLLREKKPQYLGICFDVSRDTFRQKKFTGYKINRPPMPEGLSGQLPFIRDIISAYRITVFEKEGFEADDVIATLSRKAGEKGMPVTIVSSDKDMLQLVGDTVEVFSPYKNEGTTYDAGKVFERFGVTPGQIPDIIALMGDPVDNIPGIKGIGEKTAAALIKKFGTLDKLLDNLDEVKQGKIRDTIKSNFEKIKLNKELAVLDSGMDLDFDPDKLKIGDPDYKELFKLFKHLEFKKLINELPMAQEPVASGKVRIIGEGELKELLGLSCELFLCGRAPEMFFCVKDKIFQLDKFGAVSSGMMADPGVRKFGYDLKKIKVDLARENIVLRGLHFDVMIAAYLLNPSKPEYGLEQISWDYLPEPAATRGIDSRQAIELVVKLKPRLEEELRNKGLFKLFEEIEMPLSQVLAEMEMTGIRLDLKFLKSLSRQLEKRLDELIENIYRISGCEFNINSPKQLREVLFEKLRLPVVKRTKTGPSTDEEVLKTLAGSHELAHLLLEYRQLAKLKSTYVDALPELADSEGRVHTSFNQTATETGRLSSTNPNLQNIPVKTETGRKIRQAIIAFSPDSFLLSCDYSQIELRILAHISKDENLISDFMHDKDIHKATAALIYGIGEGDVTDSMRETAKRVNFGIVYGLTAYGLSRDLGVPAEEAQDFIDAYFTRYPKVREYIERQIQIAKKDGFVATILGRRRYIPDINNRNQAVRQFAERQAVNTPIQGSASDLIKLAMIQIHDRIKKDNLKSKMILQIHDELVFDVPKEEIDGLVGLVKDRMENVLDLDVPIRVSIKKGKNWLEMDEVLYTTEDSK